jgi:glucose/arabinose dehydrogenase
MTICMRKQFFGLSLLLASFLFTHSLFAQNLPAGFGTNDIASGWDEPVGTCFNKTGTKLFVWQKGGKVYVCNRNTTTGVYTKQATPVIDLSPEVGNWRDHGLLGFTLDPNFEVNGLIYLMYVVDRHYLIKFGTSGYNAATDEYFAATIGRITRYKTATSGGNLTATTSTRTILVGETKSTGIPILHESHGVGTLAFAADGTLLASAGDAASYNTTDTGSLAETYYVQALADGIIRANENKGAFRSQMINSLDGKILRIDPTNGNGVSSNPFYNTSAPRSAASRVWAMGFRNPYRFAVKPGGGSANPTTGDLGELYVVDVGWNTYEELNIIKAAAVNCGWPLFEGIRPQGDYASKSPLNFDEVNPLYGVSGCTKRYFNFKELIKQATSDNSNILYNPCNGSTQIASPNKNRFFHRLPSLDWKHYVDSARVGVFSGTTLNVAQIGSAASGVTGTPFQGNSGIGGLVYTGNMFPSEYKNNFFVSDYGANWIQNLTMQTADKVQQVDRFATGGFAAIVCLTENPADGSIILTDIGTNEIIRVSYGGNKFPVVKMTANRLYGPAPLAVTFTGSGSSDPENGALTYSWNFGDGTALSTAANPPAHTFTTSNGSPKKFVVTLSVKDNQNQVSIDSIIISANNTPPVVNITSPVKNSTYRIGSDTSYSLKATVTDAQHTASQLKYEWQTFLRHNNHQHAESIDTNRITTSRISRIGCNGETYYFMIKLKVTDAAGLSTEDSSAIYPQCTVVPVTIEAFDVTAEKSFNLISWIYGSETDLAMYEIERSCTGFGFEKIASVLPSHAAELNNYDFHDVEPCNGDSYYRIKMINADGTYTYSKVVHVINNTANGSTITASPLPFRNEFTLSGIFYEAGPVSIRLIDMQGRVIKTMKQNAKSGYNVFRINDAGGLKAGTYIAELIQGQQRRIVKIIKD